MEQILAELRQATQPQSGRWLASRGPKAEVRRADSDTCGERVASSRDREAIRIAWSSRDMEGDELMGCLDSQVV